jgi:hypothetical protein
MKLLDHTARWQSDLTLGEAERLRCTVTLLDSAAVRDVCADAAQSETVAELQAAVRANSLPSSLRSPCGPSA